MEIKQPIAYADLESTGVSVVKDRICSIAVNIVHPDGKRTSSYKLINPGCPIPKEASDIHSITDDMVKDAPLFIQIAKSLYNLLKGCIISGYNSNDFDVIMLSEEFARAGIQWPDPDTVFWDAFNIFRKKEGRDLSSALLFYTGETMENAHNAASDIEATEKVLLAQLERYPDLKEMNAEQLAEFCSYGNRYDLAGKFVKDGEGNILFNFGKHQGKKAVDAFKDDKYYITWMEKSEFTSETLRIAREIYNFVYPTKK